MGTIIGQSLGRYHIREQLGQGGMAVVYKAYDTRLERDVAVKIIRRGAFPPDQIENILKRFEREAKSLARISHPNILKVLDYGEHEGSPYLVLEYLTGGTLKQKLKGKPIRWRDAITLLTPIARALEYAHERGIVHRDVKPSNILLTDKGQSMLSDFGIAKILESSSLETLTGTGAGVGTPEYMAPEQWTGDTTKQSDIYSLGIVLYEMITGRKPYTADTPAAILLKQASEPLPRPGLFVHDLPEEVEKALIKALAVKAKNRYKSMSEFAGVLDLLMQNTGAKTDRATLYNLTNITKEMEESTFATYQQVDTQDTRTMGNYRSITRRKRSVNAPSLYNEEITTSRQQSTALIRKSWPFAVATLIILIALASVGMLLWSRLEKQAEAPPKPSTVDILHVSNATGTVAVLNTQLVSAQKTNEALQLPATAIPTEVPSRPPPTSIPVVIPIFTAGQSMNCREGPATTYEAPWQLNNGEKVQVLGYWWQDSNWKLVDINSSKTRTDCCWVSGSGTLNVNLSSLKSISTIPSRLDCSSVK